jgi:hypothetical protein
MSPMPLRIAQITNEAFGLETANGVQQVLLWVGSLSSWLNLWDELASWAAAGLLAAVVVATLPALSSLDRVVFGGRAATGSTP